MSCRNSTWKDHLEIIVSLGYGIPSLVLYFYLMVAIYKRNIFHHPFFYQFIILSISNIVRYITIFIVNRIIPHPVFCPYFYPYFVDASPSFKLIIFGYHGSIIVEIVTIMVMCINRLSVILWPLPGTDFWKRFCASVNVGICLVSLAASFYLFDGNISINFNSIGSELEVNFIYGWPYIGYASMAAFQSLVCILVILITTSISCLRLSKSQTNVRVVERNLFWTGLGFSITTVVMTIFMIIVGLCRAYSKELPEVYIVAKTLRGWVFDANSLLPAWLMIVTNEHIRPKFCSRKSSPVSFASQSSRFTLS